MRQFKHWLAGACLATVSTLSLAGLTSADLATPGDGLLTIDDQAGLAWLNLSVTRGMSLDQALTSDWLVQGFRLATGAELSGLAAHRDDFVDALGGLPASDALNADLGGASTALFGIVGGDGLRDDGLIPLQGYLYTSQVNAGGGEVIQDYGPVGGWVPLGPVVTADDIAVYLGDANGGSAPAGLYDWAGALPPPELSGDLLSSPPAYGAFLRSEVTWIDAQASDPNWGVFLVKDVAVVPEPATWMLMALGMWAILARQRSVFR